jgi:hypothetical protein
LPGEHNHSVMTEHTFLAVMLAFAILCNVYVAYLVYRVVRSSRQIEGLTAATYLEARRSLERLRSPQS